MTSFSEWQLMEPIDAVVFDCDGTLSQIEGIDELAKNKGISETVKQLTEIAMGKTGLTPDLYEKRLELVQPTQSEVNSLGNQYFRQRVNDSLEVIQILMNLDKSIYILSAGLQPAVTHFAKLLNIPEKNVFAVNIQFDAQGNYLDFDRTSPLIKNNGKRIIVSDLKNTHSEILYVGDGLNDLSVLGLVKRFVGYGGTFYRENIAYQSHFYINTPFLSPLLPLVLIANEYEKLNEEDKKLYDKGLMAIQGNQVIINS